MGTTVRHSKISSVKLTLEEYIWSYSSPGQNHLHTVICTFYRGLLTVNLGFGMAVNSYIRLHWETRKAIRQKACAVQQQLKLIVPNLLLLQSLWDCVHSHWHCHRTGGKRPLLWHMHTGANKALYSHPPSDPQSNHDIDFQQHCLLQCTCPLPPLFVIATLSYWVYIPLTMFLQSCKYVPLAAVHSNVHWGC